MTEQNRLNADAPHPRGLSLRRENEPLTIAGRIEEATTRFEEVFAFQPYEVLIYAATRVVVSEPEQREVVVRHLSRYNKTPPSSSHRLTAGLRMFRQAHAAYTSMMLRSAEPGRQAELRRDHSLIALLTGQPENAFPARAYRLIVEQSPPNERSHMTQRLRHTMRGMLGYYARLYRIDADKLMQSITTQEMGLEEQPMYSMPMASNWQELAQRRPRLDDMVLDRLVRATPDSPQARRQLVAYFLPSIVRRVLRWEGEDRDELLQLASVQVLRSALYYARHGGEESFEPYMSQILSRFLNRAAYSRSVGQVTPLRPEVILGVQHVANARDALAASLGRPASVQEIADHLAHPLEEVLPLYALGIPAEQHSQPQESWFTLQTSQPEHRFSDQERIILERAFEFLPAGLRSTVERHYGLGGAAEMTQAEIAEGEGVDAHTIKVRLQQARAELRATIEHIRSGGSYASLQSGRTIRTVLALYDWAGIEVAPNAELEDLRAEMGDLIHHMPQFNTTDKEILYQFYGLAGHEQRTREQLVEAYNIKPGRLTDLERKFQRIWRTTRTER